MFVSFSAYPMLETSEAPADRWQTWEPKWVVQLSTCHLPTRVWHMWGPPFVEGMIPMAANFCHFSRITEMKMNFGCVSKMYGQLVSFEFEGIFGSSLCFAFRARLCKKYIYIVISCIFFWILLVVVSQICQKFSTIEICTNSSDGQSTCPPDHILLSFWCPLNPVNLSREKLCTVKPHLMLDHMPMLSYWWFRKFQTFIYFPFHIHTYTG
jgi:hypothetical protein